MSVQPPAILFHDTSSRFINKQIKHEGLKPRERQYVHLSVDQETALVVAKRKQGISFIITVQASKAYRNGIKFYQGNKTTWLADYVSADYLNSSTSGCEPEPQSSFKLLNIFELDYIPFHPEWVQFYQLLPILP
jgi:RNA:NAD 2'-phosphotransferase (TPT1/KptA family)